MTDSNSMTDPRVVQALSNLLKVVKADGEMIMALIERVNVLEKDVTDLKNQIKVLRITNKFSE